MHAQIWSVVMSEQASLWSSVSGMPKYVVVWFKNKPAPYIDTAKAQAKAFLGVVPSWHRALHPLQCCGTPVSNLKPVGLTVLKLHRTHTHTYIFKCNITSFCRSAWWMYFLLASVSRGSPDCSQSSFTSHFWSSDSSSLPSSCNRGDNKNKTH